MSTIVMVETLEERIEALEQVLGFYADPKTYKEHYLPNGESLTMAEQDKGKKAREILE